MERPIFKPFGTPADELDTPALVVELDALEHNLSVVHSFFQNMPAKLRPLVSLHGCPTLAHQQLAAGGTVDGVAVMTLGQAEVFAAYGCRDITVFNTVVTPAKLRRLCALARQAEMTVLADHATQLQRMAEAAQDQGIALRGSVCSCTRICNKAERLSVWKRWPWRRQSSRCRGSPLPGLRSRLCPWESVRSTQI
ncbi:hypothetical protein C2W62_27365 [Candidatus Entotheonella serta]|nr:hypothetical protein C2W62_27365 [Candidatus Entotheonella serta]